MKRNLILSFLLIIANIFSIKAQSFIGSDDILVNGYSRKITGLDFDYHSCIPGLRESILIRATSGKDFMEWETDPVTSISGSRNIAFIWVAAIGSSPGYAGMNLTTDKNHHFTFYTDGRPSWTVSANDGSSLSFNSIMLDQYGDYHGYMILRVPSAAMKKGDALKVKVTGGNASLTSWYMTYRIPVKNGISFNAFPAILKNDGCHLQLVEAGIFYFGEKTFAKIYADNKLVADVALNFGYNSVNIGIPEVSKPARVSLKVVAPGFSEKSDVTLNPVRKWKVDLIQHTHTDIGYTRSQTEILAEHLRYIDYALDYCDATDNYPDNARFRWTCEASWPVDEYLKFRPMEQVQRLIKRVTEGRIEVTGMYFNFDEIPDEQVLAASLSAVGRIKSRGIPVTLAMQNDVNGIGWCLNDYFSQLGIKYLNMGTHGHRALICFDIPTMFWWESPSGKRLLTFRAEHYMTGNTLFEMQTGDIDKFKNNLLNYLKNLEKKEYPYNEIAIQHSGYLTDNSPPSTIASELVRKWNEIFEWPQLTTSLAETFFKNMERDHGTQFTVIRGAWPDWWTDGFGASARETAATRKAEAVLLANMGGLSMALIEGIPLPAGIQKKTELADDALLFYTEHTTGYSESVREPFSQQTMEQRAIKDSYAWEADRRTASAGEDVLGLLQSKFEREKEPSLIVFNTLNWSRSGFITVYIDHQIVPRGMTAGIYDAEGSRLPSQILSSRSDGTYWMICVKNVPSFGFRKYNIRPVREENTMKKNDRTPVLENEWYRIVADTVKGTVGFWTDKDLGIELVDNESKYGMAEFILEKLGNRSQMESKKLDDFKRIPLDTVWFDSVIRGPVFSSIRFYGESETAISPRGYSVEIRLFNTEKRVEIICSIVKKSIVTPESFYIAFPFRLKDGKHYTEVQGGIIETGKDQIKGSANDWYTVQNFTSVKSQNAQLVLGCGEMPLMQFGAINTGRYQAGAMPQSTHIFSWPMNNYWVTNFNAEQRGGHQWTYYFTSSTDVTNSFAAHFGWGSRIPFLTRVLPGDGIGKNIPEKSMISGWPSNCMLISAKPAENGKSILIHIRETEGREAPLKLINGITGKPFIMTETDVNGSGVPDQLKTIKAFESKFYLLNLN